MTRHEFRSWANDVGDERIDAVLRDLVAEGLIESTTGRVSLARQ